ncbi:MAG: translesion error-prone DNA polymerase V autoproteolytic subunit [Bacteroidota bacterium]
MSSPVVWRPALGPRRTRPLFLARVEAGFPSPADDYVDRALDLNELCVRNRPATFFVRASGDSMTGAGIASGDLLVVDRSVEPRTGHVVVAVLDGELTVKRLRLVGRRVVLEPANDAFAAIEAEPDRDLVVWGVVTYVVHAFPR